MGEDSIPKIEERKRLNMIPKIIHYCWFGHNPKPKLAEECINSWKKYCSDYEIIEWNEDNYDISSAPLYVRQAYDAKKWAFVTDYVRLQVVYENGGIYLDTDVELVKKLDEFLKYEAYFGLESGGNVNTGLGFGAERNAGILKEMMNDYRDISFVGENGELDLTPCPSRNAHVFADMGIKSTSITVVNRIAVFPCEYFAPYSWVYNNTRITSKTVSIHHYSASWCDEAKKKEHKRLAKKIRTNHRRNMINRKISSFKAAMKDGIGQKNYNTLKRFVRRNNDDNGNN